MLLVTDSIQSCDQNLETFFFGCAKAVVIHKMILSALEKAILPLKNLLMIGYDGPNIKKKVVRLMNKTLIEDSPNGCEHLQHT